MIYPLDEIDLRNIKFSTECTFITSGDCPDIGEELIYGEQVMSKR
jgi:hypothetical protein